MSELETTLLVNRIQRCCFYDGPGIRTCVFLQGCPLRCWWCHNPETQPFENPEAVRYRIPELVSALERDARYWKRSGGGVTISGGEPLSQAASLEGLLILLGEKGYHRAVETSGMGALEDVRKIDAHTDLWLWDVKAITPETLREGTGGDADSALANLSWLVGNRETVVIARIPLIPGFNLDERELDRIAVWLAGQPAPTVGVQVELLPGHSCGASKKGALLPGRGASVGAEQLEWARRLLESNGIAVSGKPTGGFL